MSTGTKVIKVTLSETAWNRVAVEAVHRQTTMSELLRGAIRRELYEQDQRVGSGNHTAQNIASYRAAMRTQTLPGQVEASFDPTATPEDYPLSAPQTGLE